MRITELKSHATPAGGTHVEAKVDGEPLWFESDAVPLRQSAEAYASALFMPAVLKRQPLEIEAPIDSVWLEHVPQILALLSAWWRLDAIDVVADAVSSPPVSKAAGTGQCFTGGVDSFHALVATPHPPKVLVFAHGFDIALTDTARIHAFLPSLRETAAAFAATAVVIRTNLRRHAALRRVPWAKTHGGGLAALGHLLSDEVSRLVIPSSHSRHYEGPWGSHWELDHLWSASNLEVVHSDASQARDAKVRALVHCPIAMRHLRVCWENTTPTGNCSRCEKCVRTMLELTACDGLEKCRTFDLTVPLDTRVDELTAVPEQWLLHYEGLRERTSDERLARALDRLIARSRGYGGRLRRSVQWWRRTLPGF